MIRLGDKRYEEFIRTIGAGRVDTANEFVYDLAVGLATLNAVQHVVSDKLVPGSLDANAALQVRSVCLALMTEVGELADAMGTKPWKPVPESNERILDELADVLAFMGALLIYVQRATKASCVDVAEAYVLKAGKNLLRSRGESGEPGYGGAGVNGGVGVISLPDIVVDTLPVDDADHEPNVQTFSGYCAEHNKMAGELGPYPGPHHHRNCSWWQADPDPEFFVRGMDDMIVDL